MIELACWCLGMAVWGGFSRDLSDNKVKRTPKVLAQLMAKNAVISSFCGVLSMLLSQNLQLGNLWTLAIAGIAGWMGVGFLNLLELTVKKEFDKRTGGAG